MGLGVGRCRGKSVVVLRLASSGLPESGISTNGFEVEQCDRLWSDKPWRKACLALMA